MPTLRFRHALPFSAARVWRLIDDPRQLIPASDPLLQLVPLDPFPEKISPGLTLRTRLRLFRVIPWGNHTIEYASVDAVRFRYVTAERGTNLRRWRHEFHIEPKGPESCVCFDTIEFEAGWHNGIVWSFSQALYRFRYWRRRQILATQSLRA